MFDAIKYQRHEEVCEATTHVTLHSRCVHTQQQQQTCQHVSAGMRRHEGCARVLSTVRNTWGLRLQAVHASARSRDL